jgi:guanylate kinase
MNPPTPDSASDTAARAASCATSSAGLPAASPGNLFVVAAPSGAGKSSLVRALLQQDLGLALSVSHTTRAPRGQEVPGREYHFVDRESFQEMVAQGAFLEWAEVHGNLYGTSRPSIDLRLAAGEDIVLEIDWQGAVQIKRLFPGAVLVFILPPSWDELRRRLTGRGEDPPAVIETRMVNAREEVAQARHFDFVVVNANFEAALTDLRVIVQAQRLKYGSQRCSKTTVFQSLGLD